ncbi:melanin-concentrating hormone receptor 1-like isoform X2 [Emydura macquarii macquarii]|uniref:melanin-concentrating hormone receptor 1-like isoform X2 n=1 Tax=Emydura macquarii macquarii TaxID=1129001 RepID=UPI003529DC47
MAALLDRSSDSTSSGALRTAPPDLSLRLCQLEALGALPLEAGGSPAGGSVPGPALSLVLPVVYGLICGCGVLANGLVISLVLSCKQKLVSDLYILNLAVADLLFLVGMPFLIHQLLQERGWVFGDFLCRAVTTIDLNNQFTSVAIVTVLCVDRYVAVVYSSTVGQRRTLRCTALINAGVWAASLALATPAMLYARVQRANQTELCLLDLPGPRSLYWYTLYQSLAAFLLPLLVITVLYSLTLHHLFRAMRRAQRRCSARSRRVTRTALAIIAAFLVCWTPFHVVQLLNLKAAPSAASFYLNQLTICLSYAHSCVSPVLVLFCTEFFRERLARASPQVDSTVAQCRRRPFGTELLPCSVTEATRSSVTDNKQEERRAV